MVKAVGVAEGAVCAAGLLLNNVADARDTRASHDRERLHLRSWQQCSFIEVVYGKHHQERP